MVGQRLLRLEIDISIHDVSPVEIEKFGVCRTARAR